MNKLTKRGTAVANGRLRRSCKIACLALAFGLVVERSAADNQQPRDRDIWFVHATDPHIFLKPAPVEAKNAIREKQEKLNQDALSDMLKRIRSLPGGQGTSSFLVMTGDLGIDPCEIGRKESAQGGRTLATPSPAEADSDGDTNGPGDRPAKDCLDNVDPAKRKKQIDETARLLGQSPVPDIYLVAGNNDIANESAGDEAIKYFNEFIDEVQAKLATSKSNVHLHNLTRCYLSGENPATCSADILNTDYRLIGFPSYSFKKRDEKAQAKQFETFRQLLEDARLTGKKVLVVSHTPEMDDPYLLAQARYVNPTPSSSSTSAPAEAGKTGSKPTEGQNVSATKQQAEISKSALATWNVSTDLLDGWKDAVGPDSVVAVFAGHLHDSHKEIYRRPYRWSGVNEYRGAFHKLFLAPPLAVKNQDKSPIQARGFSLIHLKLNRVGSRLFWYNSETHEFTPEAKVSRHWEKRGVGAGLSGCLRGVGMRLWHLDQGDTPLVRMAVLLIALLTAFLTIVAIWQIPPATNSFAADKQSGTDASKTLATTSVDLSPFANRFGKTVIAGLGGLAVTEVAKALGNEKSTADSRLYYVVWFIVFFLVFLIFLNAWRAFVEALRARVAVVYYPLSSSGSTTRQRFKHWLGTLRVPLLTAFDTFINLIQGKNQTRTQVFEKTIIDQQRNLIRVADSIRTRLGNVIVTQLLKPDTPPASDASEPRPLRDVRVNISVLSRDQTNVFYISRSPGSSRLPFLKRSVAWVSVFSGKIRWYRQDYSRDPRLFNKLVLFDNSTRPQTFPGEDTEFLLEKNYQPRGGDYEAFAIFPVPWPQRGFVSDYVKGAIHISFRQQSDFDKIWKFSRTPEKGAAKIDAAIKNAQAAGDNDNQNLEELGKHLYDSAELMLEDWCTKNDVRTTLNDAVVILGEVLRGFNEVIYKNYIEPDQPD